MMNDKHKQEWMEQYLSGELRGENLLAFQEKILQDDSFRREVALEQAIIRNLQAVGRRNFLQKLDILHQELPSEELPEERTPFISPEKPSTATLPLWKSGSFRWMAAACVLVIIIGTLLTISRSQSPTTDTLFATYYEPYPSLSYKSRASTNDIVHPRAQAFEVYSNGQYQASIPLFKRALAEKPDEEVLFYLGNAYLSSNQPDLAAATFATYLRNYSEFEIEARWYLSLSYLKTGKEHQAKLLLTDLSRSSNPYQSKAGALLTKLK